MSKTMEQAERTTSSAPRTATAARLEVKVPELKVKTMLVPIDFATLSMQALDHVTPLAEKFGAAVHLVHVQRRPDGLDLATQHMMQDMAQMRSVVAARLARLPAERALRVRAENCHVRIGVAHEEIIRLAAEIDADMIVVATRGQSGLARIALGSTAERVVRHARCPVFVSRQKLVGDAGATAPGAGFRQILVPVDFSDCAMKGVEYAAGFAKAVGARLFLLHVTYPPLDFVVDRATGLLPHPNDAELAAARKGIDEVLAALPPELNGGGEVLVGPPAATICERADRADTDLIITSTHGRTGFSHALLGSVAEQVIRYAGSPVLTVPVRES